MKKMFGTDGVRGIANITLTPELAFSLGRVGSHLLTKNRESKNNYIIIGRDTRQSGEMLSASLSAGICSIGVDVWDLGVVPTPVVAWLVKKYDALSGVMISASHNPAQDNGIKFFNHLGNKLDDALELEIEQTIEHGIQDIPRAGGSEVGRIVEKSDIVTAYVDFIDEVCTYPINKLKVALDTANGSNYHFAPTVYSNLDIECKVINNTPDGKNINKNCGSTHLNALKELVVKEKMDLGIAFDGDADRLLAVDNLGREVDGDEIMFICSKYLPLLKNNKVLVATVMSNFGFEAAIKEMNKEFIRAKVGDRYVSEMIKLYNAKIGGEQSGHIILPEFNTTGDGLLTSLMLLEAVHRSGKTLSELKDELKLLPQKLINVTVNSKNIEASEVIKNVIAKVEKALEGKGRVLVRPSGTEPLIRVMVEGDDKTAIEAYAEEIAKTIKDEMSLVKV